VGGDEFAILAVETSPTVAETLAARLQENVKAYNTREKHHWKLSLSVGISHYDPESPCSLDELLTRADSLMYEQKRSKQRS